MWVHMNALHQWYVTTGPRTGVGSWRIRYRAVYISMLNTLKYIFNITYNCVWRFHKKKDFITRILTL